MGLAFIYIAPDPSVPEECAPLPTDVVNDSSPIPGRRRSPRVTVPITGYTAKGRVRDIERPPGTTVRQASGSTIAVRDLFFEPANVRVRRGSLLRWRFPGQTLHTVTLASGPRAFSSPNLNRERIFEHRFDEPGTYKPSAPSTQCA